ncbi:TIGR04150 pseudo-rSAM protein [Bacteroides fragilis]|nr:TIGR04150 pseudo-rSAM protein [Bacteroides fragilis]
MFQVDKNYWLVIAPYVYCCIKGKKALLYNTKNWEYLEVENENVIGLLRQLHKRDNLGAVFCEGKMLTELCYSNFISDFVLKEMGGVIDVASFPDKPIQMMPILNLQCDVDKLQQIEDRGIGEDILFNLLEINVFLYNVCDHHCLYCSKYSQQNLCCRVAETETSQVLDISALKSIIAQIRYGVVGRLNLFGGNIWKYPNYNDTPFLLSGFKGQIHIWSHYADFVGNKILDSDFFYDVIVPFPMEEELLRNCIFLLGDLQIKIHFYVTQIDEYAKAEEIVHKYAINDYSIHSTYVGCNLDYFEKYVYMDKGDILQSQYSMSQIFAHQKMNSHFFGSLSISVNGDVYANLNSLVLGNIYKDSLIDIVNKEMLDNTAWRKIRNDYPCCDCIYQWLCPSPSNYELAIGKPNLCHVKP